MAEAKQASTSGRSAEEKVGQNCPALDHRRRAPAGPGSRNRLDGRPDCPLRIQPVAAQRLWGVLDVVLAVVDFGHRVDFWVRRHRGHAAHGGDAYPGRSANLLAAEPLPERGAPPSSTTRGTSPWTPSRSAGDGAGRSAQAISARFQRTQAQFRYWADNSSKQAEAWVFGSPRLDN